MAFLADELSGTPHGDVSLIRDKMVNVLFNVAKSVIVPEDYELELYGQDGNSNHHVIRQSWSSRCH